MRRKASALLAVAAIAIPLAACGGTGHGTVTDIKTSSEATDGSSPSPKPSDGQSVEDLYYVTEGKKIVTDADKAEIRDKTQEAGDTVLIGTVRIIDGPDIFAYENVDPDTMGGKDTEQGNTYAILELDEKTHISGIGADGSSRDEDADHVGLGNDMPQYDFVEDTASEWKQYDGKHICVAGNAWFPTDVSFPMSARMSDARVLYVD